MYKTKQTDKPTYKELARRVKELENVDEELITLEHMLSELVKVLHKTGCSSLDELCAKFIELKSKPDFRLRRLSLQYQAIECKLKIKQAEREIDELKEKIKGCD